VLNLNERIRASPYYPALVHPVFRRVLPGAAASALGDGMSAVAIAWLALKLAPPDSRGLWVGAAVAAYTLPGAVGAVVLRRWLHGRPGTGLVIANAVLRATALGLADQISLMIGPVLAGVLTALAGPAVVIVLDAASWPCSPSATPAPPASCAPLRPWRHPRRRPRRTPPWRPPHPRPAAAGR
jgi:hypothetical protein